jgi:hypothetical protein
MQLYVRDASGFLRSLGILLYRYQPCLLRRGIGQFLFWWFAHACMYASSSGTFLEGKGGATRLAGGL